MGLVLIFTKKGPLVALQTIGDNRRTIDLCMCRVLIGGRYRPQPYIMSLGHFFDVLLTCLLSKERVYILRREYTYSFGLVSSLFSVKIDNESTAYLSKVLGL